MSGLHTIATWAKDFGLLLTAMGAALGFTTKWWLPYWRGWRETRQARAAMPRMLLELSQAFTAHRAFVDHELRPNNSSSIRDAIDRIERMGCETGTRVNMVVGMIRHQADANRTEATFESDSEGLCLWVNATYLRWTGSHQELVIGWGWINTIAHNDRERLRDEWEAAIDERRAFSSTYRMLDANGAPFTVECKANPIRDAHGDVVKWMGNIVRLSDLPT